MRKDKKQKGKPIETENVVSKISFKRFNKLTFLVGLLFIILAIINVPFLYNPELEEITTDFSGKPTMGPGAAVRAYIWVGLMPLVFGLIFILFSIFSGRKIILLMFNDGKCRYIKRGTSNLLVDTQVDFMLKDTLQQIRLGKRHQRFVIWATLIFFVFIIFMLIDYINFLNYSFDIPLEFYGNTLSLRMFLLIDIFALAGILLLITLFPRKLCRIDTSIEFVLFDYKSYEIEVFEQANALPYLKPFEILSSNRVNNTSQISTIPEDYPNILKSQIKEGNFKHFPLFSLLLNVTFLILMILPFLLPDFYLGSFTFGINYFLSIAAYFFIIRTVQNSCFKSQEISLNNDNRDLLIKRSNKLFGDSVVYISNIEKIEHDYTPTKPHILEYTLFFFPLWQVIWLVALMSAYPTYFFTENPYTVLYIIIIVAIFIFTISEYIIPKSVLFFTPKSQSDERKKGETYIINFPEVKLLKAPPIKNAKKENKLLSNSYQGFLLILIPIIFGLLWFILSALELIPSLYETLF